MVQRFFYFLFGNVPARFSSEFSVGESVKRNRERTKRSVFSAILREAAVGPVSESGIRCQRILPLFANSVKPIFVGKCHVSQGRVVLEGRFLLLADRDRVLSCGSGVRSRMLVVVAGRHAVSCRGHRGGADGQEGVP